MFLLLEYNIGMQTTKEEFRNILKENTLFVHFKKVDGTERKMNCTLNEKYLPKVEKKEPQKTPNEDVVVVWDLDKKAFRSFRFDSLIEFVVFDYDELTALGSFNL
jgi:hypothetical protein